MSSSKVQTLIDQKVITSQTSNSVSTEDKRNFILYLDITSTGTPTDILFKVQFSNDNSNWYDLTDWFYGDLRYEDTATASGLHECMSWHTVGRYMRLYAEVTGGDDDNYFTITAKVEFYDDPD